jgi:hypothetical protein
MESGAPDWWGTLLVVVFGTFLLIMFVRGVVQLVNYLRGEKLGLAILVFVSVMTVPSMFTSCAAVNWLSDDPKYDVFGFERPSYQATYLGKRGVRRPDTFTYVAQYVASAHGVVSMAVAIVVGLPFLLCWKAIHRRARELPSDMKGYGWVAVPLGLAFLVLLGNS